MGDQGDAAGPVVPSDGYLGLTWDDAMNRLEAS